MIKLNAYFGYQNGPEVLIYNIILILTYIEAQILGRAKQDINIQ